MRVSWAFECSPNYGFGGDRTPEKRKVGSSILPLTTTSHQRKRPGGFVREGRLTATVTATALSEGIPELPQRLALLVQGDVRVDRHRYLDVRVADDIPDHMRRNAKIEQERHARMAKIMKPGLAEPGSRTDGIPAPAQVVWLHRCSPAGREDQTVILPVRPRIGTLSELLLPVLAERFDARRRQRDSAC